MAHIRSAYLAFLLSALFSSQALAADLHCGSDTDRSGAVDLACPGPDVDWDGANSVADGGTDCDDANSACYDGIACKGSDATHFKLCTAGTFGGDTAFSSYTCKTGSGNDYFVDPGQTTCAGAGTFASPKDYRCYFNTGMSGYVALAPDDCVILKAGTYTNKWGSAPEKMFQSQVAGTSGHLIHVRNLGAVVIEGQGVSPNQIYPVDLNNKDYWDWKGNDIGGYTGLTIHGNYADKGFTFDGSDNSNAENLYVYDVGGNCGSNTCGGIYSDVINGTNTNNTITHNEIVDTYNRSALTNNNAGNITWFRGTGNQFNYNSLIATGQDRVAHAGIYYKHADSTGDGSWTFQGNLVSKGSGFQMDIASGGGTIDHNIFLNPNGTFAVSFDGGSGATYFAGASTLTYNTVINGPGPELFNTGSYEQSSAFGAVAINHNVWSDNRATTYGSSGASGFYRICDSCSDSVYTTIITGSRLTYSSNCLYNTNGVALYATVFGGAGGSGATAANFAAWQGLGLGLTSGEYSENPSFDSSNIATSTNCVNNGWRPSSGLGATPTPTATPSATPTPVVGSAATYVLQ